MIDILLSFARNGLLAVGSGLVTNGWVDNAELQTLVGAAVILISVAWKLVVRWRRSRASSGSTG